MSEFESRFSSAIALVVGLVLIAAGVWLREVEARERLTLSETSGTVVDSVERVDRDGEGKQATLFAPVVEFQAKGGAVRFTGSFDSSRQSNGNRVIVRYEPGRPEASARVVGPLEGLVPWSVFGLGGLALVTGLRGLLGAGS